MNERLRQDLAAICGKLIEQRCSAPPQQNLFASVVMPKKPGATIEDAEECIVIAKRGNPVFETLMNILRQANAQMSIAQHGHGPKPKIEIVQDVPPGAKLR